ncbi:MAG TPA: MFS transporter [Chitinophagaceae bacterium]|jgi:MFS family permease|nr:MFS transporter [Chitinophagaceae bacterium]
MSQLPFAPPLSRRVYRIAVAALFFIQGVSFASWTSRIPTVLDKMHLTEAELGSLLFLLPIGSLLCLPIAGWLIHRFQSYRVALTALLLNGCALLAIGFSVTEGQLMASLLAYGFVSNLANISINTQAVGVEAIYGRSVMATFHGMWSLAGFVAAAIGQAMIRNSVPMSLHYTVMLVVMALSVGIASRYLLRADPPVSGKQPVFPLPDKPLLRLGFIAFCAMMCEGTMFDWSGVYFKNVIRAAPEWIGAGFTAFMCTMALGRFFADRFTDRFGRQRLLQGSGLLVAFGLLLSVVFPYILPALLGFMLVGFGVSSIVPLIYGAAGQSKTLAPGLALAAVSSVGFIGFLAGPPIIGWVASWFSLRISFLLITVMALCVTALASLLKNNGE